jgi:hypothetical protein
VHALDFCERGSFLEGIGAFVERLDYRADDRSRWIWRADPYVAARERRFPKYAALWVTLSSPDRARIVLQQPVEVPLGKGFRSFNVCLPGLIYILQVGDRVPLEARETCFWANPLHPIMVSDEVTAVLEQKLGSHFMECRKTDAYLRLKERRNTKRLQ